MNLFLEKRGTYSRFGIPVKGGVYHIPERLMEIDSGYFIIFNNKTEHYEVHNEYQPHSSFCFVIPYPELDARTIQLARYTMISRIDELIKNMDENNEYLESTAEKDLMDTADRKTREIFKYVKNSSSKEIMPQDAYTTRFV